MQQQIAEVVCIAVLHLDTLERNLVCVKTEKQAWEAQEMEAEETLKALAEEQETCQQLQTELEESK